MVVRWRFFIVLLGATFSASAQHLTNSIQEFLHQRVEVERRDVGIVVGLVDEHRKAVVSCGKVDNGADRDVNGDTVFEIGSVTKTFTALLLADMVERGEVKLGDPVAKYLPKSVQMPTRNGKEITLVGLATHSSGLPGTSVTWIPKRAENPRADYTISRLYDFVTSCKLTRDPGTKYEYSTAGSALLGEAMARKAGTDYERLVQDRICRRLGMESTCISPGPQLKNRSATGHNFYGYAVPETYWGALMPGAALHSTANDLLNYLAAQLGLRKSSLTRAIEKSHEIYFKAGMDTDLGVDTDIGLAWMITREPDGTQIIQHAGLTDGFVANVCFDIKHRKGVVVLCNSIDFDVFKLSKLLLTNDWNSAAKINLVTKTPPPKLRVAVRLDEKSLRAAVGEYEFSPSAAFPKGGMMKIRCETNTLIGDAIGENTLQGAFDIFAESETNLFLKINGAQLMLQKNDSGKVMGIVYRSYRGRFPDCDGRRVSD
ncbi:MAG: serine hydrolase domain-containing protein [Limisphaerales bacterium]